VIRTLSKTGAKSFFIQRAFVKLPAQPHSEPLREHHKGENIRFSQSVNRLFLFIFSLTRQDKAEIMPSCKQIFISIHHAKQKTHSTSKNHSIATQR
jgi:hypothetical protein